MFRDYKDPRENNSTGKQALETLIIEFFSFFDSWKVHFDNVFSSLSIFYVTITGLQKIGTEIFSDSFHVTQSHVLSVFLMKGTRS